MEAVKIEYLGHACFRLSYAGQRIVLDPYADGMIPGCPPLRTEAEFVYCSHSHDDHNAVQNVHMAEGGAPRFTLTELETDHDDVGGSKRGKNTVRVFDFDGIRVAHFGDLGRMLTDAEFAALQGLDCALLPVGGFFTVDAAVAAQIAKRLRPRMVIPMHYRTEATGFDVLADIDDAMHEFDETIPVVTLTYGGYAMIEAQEDTDMTTEERVKYYREKGFNCCQSVLCALGACSGLPEETAAALASGFGGGIQCGSVCGAVTGSIMAMGCACFTGKDPAADKPRAEELTKALEAEFQNIAGTLMCADIQREYEKTRCPEYMIAMAQAAERIIRDAQKQAQN